MRFLLDENIGKKVAVFLRSLGYSVSRIRKISPGITDIEVLELAVSQKAILITSDKDFGELIFKRKKLYSGVIFLRLKNQISDNEIHALRYILSENKHLEGNFVVITEIKSKPWFKFRIKQQLEVAL